MRNASAAAGPGCQTSGPRPRPCSRRRASAERYISQVEPRTPCWRSNAYSAQVAGCGSQLASVGPKPYDGASASQGIGTRHPSRPRSVRPERSHAGSWRHLSGSVVCSGRPSSSPW